MEDLQARQEAFQDRQHKAQLELQLSMDRQLQGAALEIHSLRDEMTRAKEAKVQADAAREQAEKARAETERRSQAAQERLQVEAAEAVRQEGERLRTEAECILRQERERDQGKLEQRLTEARSANESKDSADHMRSIEEEVNARLEAAQQVLQQVDLERERERLEREAAISRQAFLAAQVRDLRSALTQIQEARTTGSTATGAQVKAEPTSKGTIPSSASKAESKQAEPSRPSVSRPKTLSEVAAAQLDATVGEGAAKWKASAKSQAAGTKTETATKQSAVKTEGASKESKKPAAKKPVPRRSSSRKGEKEIADPPSSGPDGSGDSSSFSAGNDSSDSSDSSDSGSDNSDQDRKAPTTLKDGTSLWTYRPFISYNAVEKFNENASLEDRVGWWERFMDIATQGGWSHKWRIRQLRGRMSAPLRDWYAQLSKSVRHDWKRLAHRFKHMYCRTKGSYAERYYTMKMRSGETALKFFYMLNAAAAKADMNVQKTSKRREQHVRRFMKKRKDTQLKTALQGQRFKSLGDLERALKRHEDVWREEGYDTPPGKRDFSADNDPRGKFKPRRTSRTPMAQESEQDTDTESERHVRFQESECEEKSPVPPALVAKAKGREQTPELETQTALRTQEVIDVVNRTMEAGGWRPGATNPNMRSGSEPSRSGNPQWGSSCENCGKPGHGKEYCWRDLTCNRCGRKGHPTQSCQVQPCEKCDRYHHGHFSCGDWDAFLSVKALAAKQGSLKDALEHVVKDLQVGNTNAAQNGLKKNPRAVRPYVCWSGASKKPGPR